MGGVAVQQESSEQPHGSVQEHLWKDGCPGSGQDAAVVRQWGAGVRREGMKQSAQDANRRFDMDLQRRGQGSRSSCPWRSRLSTEIEDVDRKVVEDEQIDGHEFPELGFIAVIQSGVLERFESGLEPAGP